MTSVLRLFLDRENTSVLRTLGQQFETIQNSFEKKKERKRENCVHNVNGKCLGLKKIRKALLLGGEKDDQA